MRERPEPTQLEHLSDASFLGKLLVLPANVRLDWKMIASQVLEFEGKNLRARREPTQLEHLSDASFLGKLLV